MAQKKLQGPVGMRCVKWHLKDGKPWRCARFRPPEKPNLAKRTRTRKPRTQLQAATKPKQKQKPKPKSG